MLMVSPRALSFAAIRSAWGSNSCIIARPPAVAAPTLPVPPPALQDLVERGAIRMARDGDPSSAPITERILEIRDRWHTKRHPFFLAFGEGKLPLRALGRYQALHYHFVDVRKMIAENIAEEEGLKAIPEPGHEPHDHNELILRFCRAAGISDDEVRSTKMPPAWWARSLYMYHTTATEPVGVILAMQTTQEGQMPGLIGEVLLPAFEQHYGFKRRSPEIEFFTEHDAADVEHSRRQIELCGRYLDTPQLEARAEQVAEEICELRWASISELYRSEMLGEKEILPPGVIR